MFFVCGECDKNEEVEIESEFGWRLEEGTTYCAKCAINALGPDD